MGQLAVNYQALEQQRASEMQQELANRLVEKTTDFTRSGTLKGPVLTSVANGSYDSAIEDIENFLAFKADYPNLQERAARYLEHCVDLVRAIEGKRNFPGLGGLSLAKQQDIYESVLDHFEELKSHLGQIEKIEREVKLEDARSTVLFVKIVMNLAFFVVSVGFVLEVFDGLWHSFNVVFSAMITDLVDFIL
ncbi:MAG: hypothetical protein HRT45_11590 [Bdellovibrionales bacterium]|nr:hypothetical protein [Bdellovibrionales bacterium]